MMRIEYVGHGYHVGEELKAVAEERLGKAVKLLEAPLEARVTFELERHMHRVDVQVHHRHGSLQAVDETGDMREAVILTADKIAAQAQRARKRHTDRRRRAARSVDQQSHWPVDVVARESVTGPSADGDRNPPRIIKSSLLRIKPMSIEEAAFELESELETAEHGFVVFRDSTTERVSVLYRRKDRHFGLIAPEF